ncbi:MAG: YqgE/AlgH family protein [SAR324 cluster bacterium]|nr:YqgE/AlgH family protein [SAR324 cluster bacterium]
MKKFSSLLLMLLASLALMGFEFQNISNPHSPLILNTAFSTGLKEQSRLAKGVLLIASPHLQGSYFSETVILLIDHSEAGSMGVVINRPTTVALSELWPGNKALQSRKDVLFLGGPVDRKKLLLLLQTSVPPDDASHVFADIYFAASQNLFETIIEKPQARSQIRVFAGYSGWSSQQLEHEVSRGDWRVLPGDPELVFRELPSSLSQ